MAGGTVGHVEASARNGIALETVGHWLLSAGLRHLGGCRGRCSRVGTSSGVGIGTGYFGLRHHQRRPDVINNGLDVSRRQAAAESRHRSPRPANCDRGDHALTGQFGPGLGRRQIPSRQGATDRLVAALSAGAVAGNAVLSIKRFSALQFGVERHDHEGLAEIVRDAFDFCCAELGLPADHGGAGLAVGYDGDHRLAGQFAGVGEVARGRVQGILCAAAAVTAVTVAYRAVVVVKRVRS